MPDVLEQPVSKLAERLAVRDGRVLELTLSPRASTGVIYHQHRTVHLTVTSGVVILLVEGKRQTLGPGYSYQVQPMEPYSIINTGSMTATLIEVITGQYLEADDIRYVERPDYIEERRRSDRAANG